MVLNYLPKVRQDSAQDDPKLLKIVYTHTTLKGFQIAGPLACIYLLGNKFIKKKSFSSTFSRLPSVLRGTTLFGVAVSLGLTYNWTTTKPEKNVRRAVLLQNNPRQNHLDDLYILGVVLGAGVSLFSARFSFLNSALLGGFGGVVFHNFNDQVLDRLDMRVDLNNLFKKE